MSMTLSLFGCAKMDLSGKYKLDKKRNEAIIDDGGKISFTNEGNNRLFYHIFVGSFSDSNGDGIGDLQGIINRMDYLNDGDPNSGLSLGVEGIWLSPIFTSPSYHKYDVSDYYEIDPKFGTMDDLKELIELCHQRGVKLILDLVINHTSTSNAWYQKFITAHKNNDVASEYYDFYTYSENPIVGRNFVKIAGTGHYYECNFSNSMPELNFDNPKVRQAMVDVAKFVGIMLSLTAVNVTLYILKNWWCVLLGSQLSMDLRRKLYTKIQRLSMSFMNNKVTFF